MYSMTLVIHGMDGPLPRRFSRRVQGTPGRSPDRTRGSIEAVREGRPASWSAYRRYAQWIILHEHEGNQIPKGRCVALCVRIQPDQAGDYSVRWRQGRQEPAKVLQETDQSGRSPLRRTSKDTRAGGEEG